MKREELPGIKYTILGFLLCLICFAWLIFTKETKAEITPIGKTWLASDLVLCADGKRHTVCAPGNELNTAPFITLNGSNVSYTVGDTYSELGATCSDSEQGAITVPAPSFSPALNMNVASSYVATYTCTDDGGLTDTATRTVYVNSAGGAIAFAETTLAVMPDLQGGQSPVVAPFEADVAHLNNDMCLDFFITSHATDDPDGIYIQDNVGGVCQGTYTYRQNDYSANGPTNRRITSWVMLLDLDGDNDVDILGGDVDGNPSLAATLDANGVDYTGVTGCLFNVDRCLPIDFNGDGDIELIGAPLVGVGFNDNVVNVPAGASDYGAIYSWPEGTALWTPDWATLSEPNLTRAWSTSMVFDANNDTYPDIVNPQLDIIWFGSASGMQAGVEGNFTASAAMFDTSYSTDDEQHSNPHQQIPIDYDNDGDFDIFKIRVRKGGNNAIDLANADNDADGDGIWLLQNDGNGVFTDVSQTELAGISLNSLTYQTTYAGLGVGDFNNDGLSDIRADWLTGGGFDAPCGLLINGGTGNWSKEEIACDNVLSTADGRVSASGGASKTIVTHGDYDNDGRLDLISSNAQRSSTKDTIAVWRNTGNYGKNWLGFVVRGAPTYEGFHTRVTMKEAGTSNILCTREIYVAQQYGTTHEHCGLGNNALVDIDMQLPNGGTLVQFTNVATDRNVTLYAAGQVQTIDEGATKPPATYVASSPTVSTAMILVADTEITPTATELVTFALPFAEGEVTSLDEIKVSIGGSEVAAYVEEGLTWWSDNSIRSATIQIQNVDMTSGNVTVTIDDTGFSTARLTEQPHSNGWVAAGADKNNHLYPRIFALHDTQYLADSGLIPPYDPAPEAPDAFENYQYTQFTSNFGDLDYSTSSGANWLFDRSSAMFKAYMTTGRVEFLKEGFLSKQFYFTYVRNDGTTPTAAGGDGCWTYGTVACADGKYIAPQQAKLALGLVGDDSQWDNSLINEMALQADLGWNQYGTRDAFDNENEGFTERGAGLAGLAEVVAYEITGDATILSHLNERIESLKDMQQTVKAWDAANGWTPKSGGFTHNIDVHEGVHSEGSAPTGDTDARGFSAWMSENIADFLWQAYHVTGNSDVPEMLRLLGNAVENYGFTATYDTVADTYTRRSAFTGQNKTQSCNTTGANTDHVYMASAYASDTQLADDDWWPYYSDNHNIETVLTLGLAYKFETDSDNKEKLLSRISEIQSGWINTACASTVFSNVYRLFNWQHRSNSIRTWDRILREDA